MNVKSQKKAVLILIDQKNFQLNAETFCRDVIRCFVSTPIGNPKILRLCKDIFTSIDELTLILGGLNSRTNCRIF